MSHRIWRSSGIALVAGLAFAAGCASRREVVNLREPGDLPGTRASVPEYPAVVGHLSQDSLSIYRWQDGAWYRWRARAVGRSGVEIGGYTLADGRHVRFEGSVRRSGDSLAFERMVRTRSMEAPEGPNSFVLPLGTVRSVDVWVPDAGHTAMMWGVILVFSTAMLAAAIASSFDQSAM